MQNLNKIYNWIDNQLAKRVKDAACSYFEINFHMMLNSISTFETIKDDFILKGDLFYTCKFPIKNKQNIIFRVSSDFIRIVFHDIFGSSLPVFNIEDLTPLERIIINDFFRQIAKSFDEVMLKDTDTDKIDPLDKTNLNMCFQVKNKDVMAGKIVITVPANRFLIKETVLIENFTYDDFIQNSACVDIKAGVSKILLSDLKSLEKDDIIVLENSSIRQMTLKTGTVIQEFKVNPEPSIMLDADDEGEEGVTEENNVEYDKGVNMSDNKSMWDDIQIEVSAEFKSVKMTLGELKQISKGLVIDLGSIMNNEISLLVENKTVAKGELVIINDKYGVKINEVFAAKKQNEQPPLPPKQPVPNQRPQAASADLPPKRPIPAKPQPAQKLPPHAMKQPNPKPQAQTKEDFDYSNFEE